MKQWMVGFVAVALILPTAAQARSADETAFWEEREQELWDLLSPAGGAEQLLLAKDDPLVAFRAARALDEAAPSDVAIQVAQAAVAQALRDEVAGLFRDPAAVLAAGAAGELDAQALDAIGLSGPAVAERAQLLASLTGESAARFDALASALDAPKTVWQQDTWDTYGLVVELALLTAALTAPELAGWILPNNIRVMVTHIAVRIVGPVEEGNVNNGRIWTQGYADALVGIAMDNHGLTDAIVLQIPITLYVELNWRCTQTLFGVCVGWSFGTVSGPGDSVVATNAQYTFAYPATGGELATRATGQDILQSAYDRLGALPFAAPTEFVLRSQAADTPGANELMTQAPPVTYTGTQLPWELTDLWGMFRNARIHPRVPGLDVAGFVNVGLNLGPTVGYTAEKVENGHLTMLIVRWHNMAVEEIASPGTFYYDVPPGEYKLTDARVDTWGGVVIQDWAVAAGLPVEAPDLAL